MVPAMADESVADTVTRISERLRKDHPDPAIRAELYAGEYVRSLMQSDDDKLIERVIAGVRGAEDGTPAHDE